MSTDIIDRLAGIEPGSPLDGLRRRRPDAREHAQRGYLALFPQDTGGGTGEVSLVERYAVAAFVAGLHRDPASARHYDDLLSAHDPDLAAAVSAEVEAATATGPYGIYPEGPLAAESVPGPVHRVGDRAALGERLAAALEHAHLLVFRPREADPQALRALARAGWSTTGVVTLSQLVSFLTFQIRVVAGLRLLRTTQKGPRP
ncbi:CMD domain protein [Nonomuraea rhodomycinica]|uniref:CMD domain protein n=1 Tax=Nonomuraea rhodomycinica TaxID=1712872 RepID=A0A7Y6IUV8_9ACTN|nr:CMD domain protein [Nonomuraea rhodomycinica]NUW44695.1 CMD domain protein [Nonomuraea rhodomycinica]